MTHEQALRDFFDSYDSYMQKIGGCTDGYCFITGRAEGVHTNGGCHCYDDRTRVRRCLQATRQLLDRLRPVLAAPAQAEPVAKEWFGLSVRDAERYRALRRCRDSECGLGVWREKDGKPIDGAWLASEELDEAIDQFMDQQVEEARR